MLDVADPEENYSVARYVSDAVPIVDDILSRGKLPIIAGGTGLYIDGLVAGREFAAFTPDSGLRESLQARAREEGLAPLWAELSKIDPEAAQRIHPNDEKRILRALEVWHTTGKTISQHDKESKAIPNRYTPLTIGLDFADRADLRTRIDLRVDEMMERGLVAEVQALLDSGISPDCTAMQAIGYKEMAAALLEGRPAAEGAEEIKLRSRQYAKRQLTWFRRNEAIHWHRWGKFPDFSAALAFSTELLHAHELG
jgi:tRNA dimethylallyltransferase